MSHRVFITGIGITSAIGGNVPECLDSLMNSRHGVDIVTLLDTIHKDFPLGEIKLLNKQLCEIAGLPDDETLTRTTLLGLISVKEALKNSGIENISDSRIGFISGTTVGGMSRTELAYDKTIPGNIIDTHDCGESTNRIASILGISGYSATISTACSSSANSIMLSARMIQNELLDKAIAGGTDSLSRFTLNGFNSLMILDKDHCKPFDAERRGINLGEGAAYLVLETEESLVKSNRKPLCELKGWANANDAYHQTASSPDGNGAYLAISKAITKSGLNPEDIDYINAHGTGTDNNDLSEGIAIERIFGNKVPPISSTKPLTGHTLGASGAIEAVLSFLSIKNKLIYPNLNFKTKIPELTFTPNIELRTNAIVRNVLSNSFGFGGNNTSLIFSAID